jgi:hypothetical protein
VPTSLAKARYLAAMSLIHKTSLELLKRPIRAGAQASGWAVGG